MNEKIELISGNIVDVLNNKIYSGTLFIKNGKIEKIAESREKYDNYILPGFIDSHIHIESSMLTPVEFAKLAVKHGTVSVVADPHEIANVLGAKGIDFMISQASKTHFKFYFAAPSCVPATENETSGATLGVKETEELLKKDEIKCLGEMMDFNGVIEGKKDILGKIQAAKNLNKPIDGHIPEIKGENLKKYIDSGISTDHECSTLEEAIEKINLGMKIQIREGSAAKDFEALSSLIQTHPDFCMFSSDDKHPNDLFKGHINQLVKRSIQKGYDLMKVLKCASINPVIHYKLDVGLLQIGDCADFIEIDNLEEFNIQKTVINGEIVFENGSSLFKQNKTAPINNFNAEPISLKDIQVKTEGENINVIEAFDGSLLTKKLTLKPNFQNENITTDINQDILKIVVLNRYKKAKPSIGFIKGFGLKNGAIASSVAHDSHNIIAVGATDEEIIAAINSIVEAKGGLCTINKGKKTILELPIAGLMSNKDSKEVISTYEQLELELKSMGCQLNDAFMTLSFMSLTAIPEIKLSDKGLFYTNSNKFIKLHQKK